MIKTTNIRASMVLLAAAISAGAMACKSSTQTIQESADKNEHNRMLVRMALAENVYNGMAAEGAVYPKDFNQGSATLNALGERRVETLIHAYRGGSGKIVVIHGEESDEVYAQRLDTVRHQFADAGFKGEVEVGRGTLAAGSSSERGIVSFDRMMSTYRTPAGGASTTTDNQSGNTSFSK